MGKTAAPKAAAPAKAPAAKATQAQDTDQAQDQPKAKAKVPTWVATTPLRYQGERIETGAVVPDLTAEQAAELGDLVRPADEPATDTTDGSAAGASTTTED